jgi:phage-related protein
VMSRGASRRVGYGALERMNAGGMAGTTSRGGDIYNIAPSQVSINGGGGGDIEGKTQQAKALQAAIDKAIFDTIMREQRSGGILTRFHQPRA